MNQLIRDLKNKKNKISAYGASGKGQALMQFCKIDNNFLTTYTHYLLNKDNKQIHNYKKK